MGKRNLLTSLVTLLLAAGSAWADAAPVTTDAAGFIADAVTYDQAKGQIIATGNVEVTRDGRLLKADRLTYTGSTRKVVATGNVSLQEPTGETLFAETAEITDDLKEGVIERIRVAFPDASRFLASRATRTKGPVNTLEDAAFTPCKVCGDEPPLWEIRSRHVVHDEREQEIRYRNATLDVLGVPVFWLPYLSHPDPTVDRKSGLLTPRFGSSTDRGFMTATPYYHTFSPSQDVVLTPMLMTRAGAIGSVDYRQQFTDGETQIKGSAGRVRKIANGSTVDQYQGAAHLNATGKFDIDEHWRWNFAANRVSDRGYLRRFGFDGQDILTSQLNAERFTGNSYLTARSYAFQGLRPTDDPRTAPLVTPEISYGYTGNRDRLGGVLGLQAGSLVLSRRDGVDSRRISFGSDWERPWQHGWGGITRFVASLDGDFYNVENVPTLAPGAPEQSGNTGRVLPQLALRHSVPFVKYGESITQILTPEAGITLSPNGMNPDRIPNEDSQVFAFDTTNLFSLNRFGGRDRVDSGQRADYGLGYSAYGLWDLDLQTFIGQSYRLKPDATYGPGSGLNAKTSDYVGRLSLIRAPLFDLSQQFRLDRDTLSVERNDIMLNVMTAPVQFTADYFYTTAPASPLAATLPGKREEIAAQVSTLLPHDWVTFGRIVHDLQEDQTRLGNIGVSWFTQCIAFTLMFEQDNTNDPLAPGDTAVMFRVDFRQLGQGDLTNWLRTQNRLTGRPQSLWMGE